jgi:hypothetical protein
MAGIAVGRSSLLSAGTIATTAFRFGQAAREPKPPDSAKVVVSISFGLKPDGTLLSSPRSSTLNAPDRLVEDVIRAIERCQPYDMLPGSKYQEWKDVLIRFRIERSAQQTAGKSRP